MVRRRAAPPPRRRPGRRRSRTDPVGTGQVADTIRIHLEYDPPGAGPPTLVAKVPSADETSRAGAAADAHVRDRGQLLPRPRRRAAGADAGLLVRRPRRGDERLRRRARGRRAGRAGRPDARLLGRRHRRGRRRAGAAPRAAMGRPDAARHRVAAARPSPEAAAAHGASWSTWAFESFESTTRTASSPRPSPSPTGSSRTSTTTSPTGPSPGRSSTATSAPTTCCSAGRGSSSSTGRRWALGAGPTDLAYLLGASLLPEVRRDHEDALVDRYVAGLARPGRRRRSRRRVDAVPPLRVRRPDHGDRRPGARRRTDRGDEMFITMADRHSRQALDLDSESLSSDSGVAGCSGADGAGRSDAMRGPGPPPPPRTASS